MIKTRTALLCALLLGLTPMSHAQNSTSKQPLEITADGSLEWFRASQRIIARKNALAQQDGSSIAAETLSANYRDGAQGRFEISKITATQNVIIRSKNSTAYGDNATYELDESLAIMTGENLRMISPDQSVTAKDRFEYHVDEGKLLAIGNAVATRPNKNGGTDKLRADTITAIFKENAQGERVLNTLEATGNVVITTPTETITGTYGIYRSASNKAELTGGVTIIRGPNTLEGNRAEIDLDTQTSQLFGGGKTNNGRVKAVFYPSKDEE